MTDDQKAAARARAEGSLPRRGKPVRLRCAPMPKDARRCRCTCPRLPRNSLNSFRPTAIVYDESITHMPELIRHVVPGAPGSFFQTPGGTLGIAFPGAIGVRLAYPERTVIGFGGDGGAMYTLPALWTAAHYRVGAKFVLCHNRSYRLLKNNLVAYWRERNVNSNEFPAAFDIDDPVLDYVSLAKGLGVPGTRVARPAEIAPAIRQMLDHEVRSCSESCWKTPCSDSDERSREAQHLAGRRNAKAAKPFLSAALRRSLDWMPRVINTPQLRRAGWPIAAAPPASGCLSAYRSDRKLSSNF